ncbi:AbfB domain-containing protein [Kitasatospora terrestris]|uniref:Alpha-L-arabinofuranosidase B arabinose-binding domain-containing protein n=1 Tax=Kitasatospora terrestris TaxID=258051 RepID=A0ABP9EGR5_9ACTN
MTMRSWPSRARRALSVTGTTAVLLVGLLTGAATARTAAGTGRFAADATFCAKPGNSGTGSSRQSLDHPAEYLRHYRLAGCTASDGGTNAWDNPPSWAQDSSRLAVSPWG